MIGFLWDIIRDTFEPICCKHCRYKSIFAVGLWWHITRTYKTKLTKRDWRFLAKYNLLTRLVKTLLCLPIFLVCVILKVILTPIYFLYEIL